MTRCSKCGGHVSFWKSLGEPKPILCAACQEATKEKASKIAAYKDKLTEIERDQYLSKQEEGELEDLRLKFGLDHGDISFTLAQIVRLRKLTAIKDGALPIVQANIVLKKGEVCHYAGDCGLIEEKSRVKYIGGSQGIGFKVARGVYYRVGGFKGERVVETSRAVTDTGSFFITNKRILFLGRKKTVSYPVDKIVNFVKFNNAIQFQKENESSPRYFMINDVQIIDEIGLIFSKIVS